VNRTAARPAPIDSDEEELPPCWRPRRPRQARVAVLAGSSDVVTALMAWVTASPHELVLAVQLQPSDAVANPDRLRTAPGPVGDVPLLLTRTPTRTIAPLVRDLAVDVLVSSVRQVLPVHVAHSPRTGTVDLRATSLPGGGGSSWVLRSPSCEVLAASAPVGGLGGAGEPGGREFCAVLDDGLRRWFASSATA
jgi:hypothetical protein